MIDDDDDVEGLGRKRTTNNTIHITMIDDDDDDGDEGQGNYKQLIEIHMVPDMNIDGMAARKSKQRWQG